MCTIPMGPSNIRVIVFTVTTTGFVPAKQPDLSATWEVNAQFSRKRSDWLSLDKHSHHD